MKKILVILLSISILICLTLYSIHLKDREELSNARINIKAYEAYMEDTDSMIIRMNRSLAELNYSKNALEKKLLHTIDSLKIKRKTVKEIQYIESTFNFIDTVFFRDSIYTPLDTTFGNQWYELDLIMADKFVSISPTFKSEKHIIIENKKETVYPPKKFFLFRWFQRKHTVQYITVVEKNPYMKSQKSMFINILKN